MSTSIFAACVTQPKKMLENLERWLDKGTEQLKAKSVEPSVLLGYRLAPDQYPLLRQIQGACDAAKFLAARVADKPAPKHPDTETSLEEIRARLRAVVEYLGTFDEADFAGGEERVVALPFLEGKVLSGRDYMLEMAIPNFYFHVTTAYAILRHAGVDLGKRDYLGSFNLRDA